MRISDKWKAVVAGAGTIVTALTAAFADDVLSTDEVGTILATTLTAVFTVWGVWYVKNQDKEL